jgi:hypothetical protein
VLAAFHAERGRLDRARDVVAQALDHRPGNDLLLELQDKLAAQADG